MVTRHAFTVYAIGEPEASLIGIRVLDRTTGTWYSVYPERLPAKCTPDGMTVSYGAQNVGDIDGMMYGRILGPGGVVLYSGNPQWCHAGDFVYWEPILTMPAYDIGLEVQVSASPTYAVSEKVSFNVESTAVPPVLPTELSLPMIGALALAVVDILLVSYSIAAILTPET